MEKKNYFLLGIVTALVVSIISLWCFTWLVNALEVEKELNSRRLPNLSDLHLDNVRVDYWDCRRPEIVGDGCTNQFSIKGTLNGRPVSCYGNTNLSPECFFDK